MHSWKMKSGLRSPKLLAYINFIYSTTMQLCQLNQSNLLLTSLYVHKLKFIFHKLHPSSSSHGQLHELVNFVNTFLNVILDYLQNRQSSNFKSSRLQMFFKIGVLKNFAIFPGKHLCQSYFLIKLQAWRSAILLKRDFNTGVFL